jgi:hypothetical protein
MPVLLMRRPEHLISSKTVLGTFVSGDEQCNVKGHVRHANSLNVQFGGVVASTLLARLPIPNEPDRITASAGRNERAAQRFGR